MGTLYTWGLTDLQKDVLNNRYVYLQDQLFYLTGECFNGMCKTAWIGTFSSGSALLNAPVGLFILCIQINVGL